MAYVDEGFESIHESPIHGNYVYTVNVFVAALACRALGGVRWERSVTRFFPWILAGQYEEGYIRPHKTAREGLIDTPFLLIALQLGNGHLSFAQTSPK